MRFWSILSAILEPSGVFLLSVEAIKLANLRRLTDTLKSFYAFLNPQIKFTEFDAESRPEDRHPLYDRLNFFWITLLMIFVITPFILVLLPVIALLSKIEANTRTGTIGILGFILWFASFVINRVIHS
jgi:hypothetical protein